MPRGHPDWGVNVEQYVFVDYDTSELAARLESPVTYNRSGRVVHIDRCVYGALTWEDDKFGLGAAVALDTTKAFRNEKSLKLTGGSDGLRYSMISKQIPLLNLSKVGAEFSFALTGIPPAVGVRIIYFDGTNYHDFYCYLSFNNLKVRRLNSSNAFTDIGDIVDLRDKPAYWHTFKIVVDLVDLVYVKFMLDDVTIDLTGLTGYSTADAAPVHIQAGYISQSDAGENRYSNVNDFIFTIDEP